MAESLSSPVGGSGTLVMTPPFPAGDNWESPIIFVALTLAKMLPPHAKLNGSALNVENGIIHLLCALINKFEPSQ